MAGELSERDQDILFLLKQLPNATLNQQGVFCDYVEKYIEEQNMFSDMAREYAFRDIHKCSDCVFHSHDFIEYCAKNRQAAICDKKQTEIKEKCAVCGCDLDAVTWFVFGDKCGLHGIED